MTTATRCRYCESEIGALLVCPHCGRRRETAAEFRSDVGRSILWVVLALGVLVICYALGIRPR